MKSIASIWGEAGEGRWNRIGSSAYAQSVEQGMDWILVPREMRLRLKLGAGSGSACDEKLSSDYGEEQKFRAVAGTIRCLACHAAAMAHLNGGSGTSRSE